MEAISKLKVIITGATGMVGEGVLHECLQSITVEKILLVNRRPCGIIHPKLKEIIHTDFFNWKTIEEELVDYNSCMFCLGVSSIGMKEPEFFRLTYTLTMHAAETLARLNSDMTFCYISGVGTDSTEKGSTMWARVKGKTENDLIKLPFKKVFNFRPGALEPTKGLKNTLTYYKYISWLFPVFRTITPNHICTLAELGRAMIYVSVKGYNKQIVEVKDVHLLANL